MNPIEGIHHITLITGDAPGNVDFYARVLGLRLVKKTVNQDDPGVYHLFYADEHGSPGADITFFEYPGAAPGRAGAGMISRIVHRVASEEALDFWQERLGSRRHRHRARARTAAVLRSRGHGPRARRRHHQRRAAHRGQPRGPGRVRPPGLRGRARAGRTTPPVARRCWPTSSASPSVTPTTGRRAVSTAAAASSSSSPTSAASPAPAPCITSPGRCSAPSSTSGSVTSPRRAPTPPR